MVHVDLVLFSFKTISFRYLDLKGNPLTPALAKIVGPCLTLKDCQNAARNTVSKVFTVIFSLVWLRFEFCCLETKFSVVFYDEGTFVKSS